MRDNMTREIRFRAPKEMVQALDAEAQRKYTKRAEAARQLMARALGLSLRPEEIQKGEEEKCMAT